MKKERMLMILRQIMQTLDSGEPENITDAFTFRIDDTVVYTPVDVISYFELFSNYTYYYTGLVKDRTALENFMQDFINYKSQTITNFERIYAAFYAEYNPLENYNETEITTEGDRIDNETQTTTPTGEIQNDNIVSRTTFDTTNPTETDRNESTTSFNNAATTTTTEKNNTLSAVFDDETKTGFHTIHERYYNRHGDIGVKGTQAMIEDEMMLRKTNILHNYLKGFIKTYCFYAGEGEAE